MNQIDTRIAKLFVLKKKIQKIIIIIVDRAERTYNKQQHQHQQQQQQKLQQNLPRKDAIFYSDVCVDTVVGD